MPVTSWLKAVLLSLLLLVSGLSLSLPVLAQGNYPSRPVRLLIPFAPGGATDIFARRYAERMAKRTGQPFLTENKAGASGIIAAQETARSAPDGHTLFFATSTTLSILPHMMTTPAYDVEKDFAPVAMIGKTSLLLVVHASVPARSVGELVALIRANPGKYSYGSSGVGSTPHLAGELFKLRAGNLDLLHVPYKGSGPALQDALAGINPVFIDTFSGSQPHHKAGKMRILAIFSETRSNISPETPTAIEAGIPGMVAGSFQVVTAPGATPPVIIQALRVATGDVMKDTAFQAELQALSIDPIADSTPESAKQYIRQELAKWGPIVRATGVKLEQ